jgi:diacylglycerol kinase family enzyme
VLLGAEPFLCTLNGRPQSCLMFAVCNAPMIGGGRLIAPDASPDDGALDVCAVSDMGLVEFVTLLRRVADGSHVTDERVTYFTAREVALEFDRPVTVNADGEVFEARACRYDVLPGAVQLLAP